jgi:hypothetical protein
MPAVLAAAGATERCRICAGDYFKSVPLGADGYVLKTILHDWRDGEALQILRNVATAMQPEGRLIVIEALLDRPGNAFDIGKLMDLSSLVLAGGPDRGLVEIEELMRASGFRVTRVTRTTNALAVLEARLLSSMS